MSKSISSTKITTVPSNNISFGKLRSYYNNASDKIINQDMGSIIKVFGAGTSTSESEWDIAAVDARPLIGFGLSTDSSPTWTAGSNDSSAITTWGDHADIIDNDLSENGDYGLYFSLSSPVLSSSHALTLQYDAGSVKRIVEYRLYPRDRSPHPSFPRNWILQAKVDSSDGWTEIDNQQIDSIPVIISNTANDYRNEYGGGIIRDPGNYRYYQFVFTSYFNYNTTENPNENIKIGIGEIVFYTSALTPYSSGPYANWTSQNSGKTTDIANLTDSNTANRALPALNSSNTWNFSSNTVSLSEQNALQLKYTSSSSIIPYEYRLWPANNKYRAPFRWRLLASNDDTNYDLLDVFESEYSQITAAEDSEIPHKNYLGSNINKEHKYYKYFKFVFTACDDNNGSNDDNIPAISQLILYKYNQPSISLSDFRTKNATFQNNTAYRYYKIDITRPVDDSQYLSFCELALYQTINGVDNVLIGAGQTDTDAGASITGSTQNSVGSLTEVFDNRIINETGNIYGFYEGASNSPANGFVQIDFGSGNEKIVNKYRIWVRPGFNSTQAPGSWTFSGSSTGTDDLILGAGITHTTADVSVAANSERDDGSPTKLFNNIIGGNTTGWHANNGSNFPHFIKINFSSAKTLSRFYMWPRYGSHGKQFPTAFQLYASNSEQSSISNTSGMTPIYTKEKNNLEDENSTYYDRTYTGSTASGNIGDAVKFYIPSANRGSYRYYTLKITDYGYSSGNPTHWVSIGELAMYDNSWTVLDEQNIRRQGAGNLSIWPNPTNDSYASENLDDSLAFNIGSNPIHNNSYDNTVPSSGAISINSVFKGKTFVSKVKSISNLLVDVNPTISLTKSNDNYSYDIAKFNEGGTDVSEAEVSANDLRRHWIGATNGMLRVKKTNKYIPIVPHENQSFTLVFVIAGNYGTSESDTMLFCEPMITTRFNHRVGNYNNTNLYKDDYPGTPDETGVSNVNALARPDSYNGTDKFVLTLVCDAEYPGNTDALPDKTSFYANGVLKGTTNTEDFDINNGGGRYSAQEMNLLGWSYFSALNTPRIDGGLTVYGSSSNIKLYSFQAYQRALSSTEITTLTNSLLN